jgi:hypothetical protein
MGRADKFLLLVVPFLAVWIAIAMRRRSLEQRFPYFFAYVASLVGIGILRFIALGDYRVYFWVFWVSEAIYASLALLALHEVFRQIFLGFYLQYRWFRVLFPYVAGTALLFTTIVAVLHPPVAANRLISVILCLGVAVSVMQLSLFVLFVFLARSFVLPWRVAPLGITLGFAVSALGTTVAYSMVSVFGTKLQTFGKYAPPVAYILAALLWLDTFLRPEAEPQWGSTASIQEIAQEIRRETTTVKRMTDKLK